MEKEHLEMILEDINGKFDLILEGYASLNDGIRELASKADQRFDMVEFKIETLNKKIDMVAVDLTTHRHDTEVHRGYQVKED